MPDTPRPSPGNYRSTPGNELRKDPTPEARPPIIGAGASPTFIPASMSNPSAPKPPPPPAAKDDAKESAEGEDVVELTPAEAYAERLAEAKISRTEANSIFDAVMSKDYYEEYVKIGSNRAVFRSRMYEDHLRLQTALELQRPGLVISQEDMITRYNLAASLYEWRGEALPHNDDADFDKILNIIKKMPGPVYSLLAQKLAVFDQKVMLVFSEGATDSF